MGEIILRVAVEVKVKRDFSSVFFALNAPLRQYVKYIEVILQPQQTLFFVVIWNIVYFTTIIDQRGHFQVIHNTYEIHLTDELLRYTSSSITTDL